MHTIVAPFGTSPNACRLSSPATLAADAGSTKTNGHGYFGWNTSVKPSACYRYRAIYKGNSNGWAAKSTTAEWSNCG